MSPDASILHVFAWFRIGLFLVVTFCAASCIIVGLILAGMQVVHLMNQKEETPKEIPEEKAIVTRDSVELKLSIAVALVVIGFLASIAVLNSPIRLEFSTDKGYGVGILPFKPALVSSAYAQTGSDRDSAILQDFCKFTIGRSSIAIRGADGDLSLGRARLLRSLNKAENADETKEKALGAKIGENLLKDPGLRRHMRYIIVQDALPSKDVVESCKAQTSNTGARHGRVAGEIIRLLREGENDD